MARAAAPMLRGLRGLTRTTRRRSNSASGDKGTEFTAGEKKRSAEVNRRNAALHAARQRLARAARGNIDCGRIETKSLPVWPEVPAFRWACWHGRIQALHDSGMAGVIIQSFADPASDRGAALRTARRRTSGLAGGS